MARWFVTVEKGGRRFTCAVHADDEEGAKADGRVRAGFGRGSRSTATCIDPVRALLC